MIKKTAKNTQKQKSWQGPAYGVPAAAAWDGMSDFSYMSTGFGSPQPWLTPLDESQSDFLYSFAEQLHPYQVQEFLTPAAQDNYRSTHWQRGMQKNPPCYDPPPNLNMMLSPLAPTGAWDVQWCPPSQEKTKKGKKAIGDTDQGENQEKEKDKATDFWEGEVYFSRWEEWHELQRAINHGKLNGKTDGIAFAEWKTWVQQWREPDAAWQKLQKLQKDIDGYRKELEALDKQFEETGGHTNKMDCKNKMDQAISNVEQTECMPEEEEDEDEKDEDEEREEKMNKILSGKIWNWFKQKDPPPWQVEWDSFIEPAGKEWWKGKVNKLSQNINVHADGKTYKNSSTNPKKVECMSTRAIQMEIEKGTEEVRGRIYAELQGNSKELVKHVDGHHVLKEVLLQSGSQPASSPSQVEWIIEDIHGHSGSNEEQPSEWVKLAKQRYGCRVLISMLNRMQSATIQPIIKALVDHESTSKSDLAKHKFGFYVIQVLVENQTAWAGEPKDEPIKQALTKLISTLTIETTNLMMPEPEKNEKDGAQEGKKSNNNNPDCNGAAVLCQAMRNPCIPFELSKSLYDSVLTKLNHKWLAAMGCTRFGEQAVKSALGIYAAEDGMAEKSRVEDALLNGALQYLVRPDVAEKLGGCRYGKLLLKCVKARREGLTAAPACSDGEGDMSCSEDEDEE